MQNLYLKQKSYVESECEVVFAYLSYLSSRIVVQCYSSALMHLWKRSTESCNAGADPGKNPTGALYASKWAWPGVAGRGRNSRSDHGYGFSLSNQQCINILIAVMENFKE